MIREVDLVSYLPPFMAEFKEINATLEAENPEFRLVWEAANRVLSNEFIMTADEYGISRYENLLKIFPSSEDTLESRRLRVQSRWFNELPYSMKVLIQKLIVLCGDSDFSLDHNFTEGYTLTVKTDLETFGQVDELDSILNALLPCTIVIDSINTIPCSAEGTIYLHSGAMHTGADLITNDGFYRDSITQEVRIGAIPIGTVHVAITNDYKSGFIIKGEHHTASTVMRTARTTITNDYKAGFEIKGEHRTGSGVASTGHATISNDFKEAIEIKSPLNSGVGVTITEISIQKGVTENG